MSKFSRLAVGVSLTVALAGAAVAGCGNGSKSSPATPSSTASSSAGHTATPTSASAQPSDYTRLLIAAGDINAPEVFTATPPTNNPNGQPGASTTFSNNDRTHVIIDSIQILPDPVAAQRALESAKSTHDGYVHGTPEPIAVGTGGTTISGPSPDGAKGVTVLLFTEGRAFVELEFDGPPSALVPPDFVTDVGQKQDAAVKNGLGG
ncbi:hypothetical protein MMAN_10950 [Mycobacterium mantenii]|uniref:Lipoprotein LpqN n=1 Tax=Mycobacterium mantenii TaxID=560555 RepID=A0A1X0FBG3_MYCNT|nr:hypothetical protein [Mycobacterium mantenii]MCV7243059.1 hypothetical protein [Mycobacterium mantenii]ORA99115.1 hypothetical protein BST30_24985 [Mycobacterium mantenii]BBY36961.1 hypothetical protein MMAN_10950 [Mycobacterium mantenii]